MSRLAKVLAGMSFALAVVLVVNACDGTAGVDLSSTVPGVTAPASSDGGSQFAGISDARKNAARFINPAGQIRVDIRQFTGIGLQNRCDPLGLNGGTPWPSTIGAAGTEGVTFTPAFVLDAAAHTDPPSEYDLIGTVGETDYILSLRVPQDAAGGGTFPDAFTQVEFSFRAVNPEAYIPHVGANYIDQEADFPSNDDVAANRSLFNMAGEDVAILVQGIDFEAELTGVAPGSTGGYMTFLGPTGWVLFMRDNAYRSGRFYEIAGAVKGGPVAYYDTDPGAPDLTDDGMFESVQVQSSSNLSGTSGFENNDQPAADMDGTTWAVCDVAGGVTAGAYAFLDRSNLSDMDTSGGADHIGNPDFQGGAGGFLLCIRPIAFLAADVVVFPNTPGDAPALVGAADTIPALNSGYDESAIPETTDIDDNTNNGPPGVHEIGVSVFFIHGS